jgi:hypothetical protein
MDIERSLPYPVHPELIGYLTGMAAVRSEVNIDGLDIATYELPNGIDETLVSRKDFLKGVNDAYKFRDEMDRQLPKRGSYV